MDVPANIKWPVGIICKPSRNSKQSSCMSIGKALQSEITRMNANVSPENRIPINITDPSEISSNILTTMGLIIASHPRLGKYFAVKNYTDILEDNGITRSQFYAARDDCVLSLIEREPILQCSMGSWVTHRAFVDKLAN